MKDTDAAWLAGIIDGEGAIWCRWPKRTNVVVEVKMTDLRTLEHIQSLWPGRLVNGQLSERGWSKLPQFRWSIDTLGAAALLTRIEPFMVTKREVARAAIELCRRPIDRAHMDLWAVRLRDAA